MDGIGWSTIFNNYGSFAVAVTVLIGGFWAVIRRQTKVLISESAVSAESYKEEQRIIKDDIEQLKKSDAEFRVIKNQIDTMQRGQTALKDEMQRGMSDLRDEIQTNAKQHRDDLSGATERLRLVMMDFIKASK